MSYKCSTCGEIHTDLPHIGDGKPYYWYTIPEQDRESIAELTEDTCIIDNEDYFIRGVISIPVLDYGHDFGFGAWVSQKKENFYKYLAEPDTDRIGPFFGWLSTEIAYYEESTLSLHTMAHFVGDGHRPEIKIEPTDHQLAIDQQEGITIAKAWEIVHFYMDR
jgi:hypothetical protein